MVAHKFLISSFYVTSGCEITPCIKTDIPLVVYIYIFSNIMWASTRENLSSGFCEQQRRRPACQSAQSDQHLSYSLFEKYHIKAC